MADTSNDADGANDADGKSELILVIKVSEVPMHISQHWANTEDRYFAATVIARKLLGLKRGNKLPKCVSIERAPR